MIHCGLFVLAMCQVSEYVNLVTFLSKVYVSKSNMKDGKIVQVGCW